MALTPITHLRDTLEATPSFRGEKIGTPNTVVEEFSKLLSEKIGGLIETTQNSARLQRDFAAGKTDNIHEVMIAGAKSSLVIETALQVRNLALRAYQALSQIR